MCVEKEEQKEIAMTSIIQQETINNEQFLFIYNENTGQCVEYKGKQYSSLTDLVHDVPFLSDPKNIVAFCKIANFIFRGLEFNFIEDIAKYQKLYHEVFSKILPEYGIYDLTPMQKPKIENGKAVFYVENSGTHVPYHASCTFPFKDKSARYDYELLKEI